MGCSEMAEKHKNPTTQVCGCRRLCRSDLGASDDGWPETFTGVVVWSSSSSISRVYSSGGQNQLPRLKPDRPKNGSNIGVFGFFLDFLSGFGVVSSLGTQK